MFKRCTLNVIFLLTVAYASSQQGIKIFLSKDNKVNFTTRWLGYYVSLYDKGVPAGTKKYVPEDQSTEFQEEITKDNYKNYKILVEYDQECFSNDISVIDMEVQKIKEQRLVNVVDLIVGVVGDNSETFKGTLLDRLSNVYGNYQKLNQMAQSDFGGIINDLMTDHLIGLVEFPVVQLGIRYLLFAAKDKPLYEQWEALEQKRSYAKRSLNSTRTLKVSDYVALTIKYELSIEGTIPIMHKYKFLNTEDIKYGQNSTLIPYSVRLINFFGNKSVSHSGWYIPIGYSQSPFMYSTNLSDTIFKPGKLGSFNHIDLAIGYILRLYGKSSMGLSFNIELGARANFLNYYDYKVKSDKVSDISKVKSFKYDQRNAVLNVGSTIDLKYLKIVARHSNTISKRTQGKPPKNLGARYFQVGIQVPIYKKYMFNN